MSWANVICINWLLPFELQHSKYGLNSAFLYPHHKMWGGLYWIRFVASVGRSVRPSPIRVRSITSLQTSMTHSPQLGDVQSPCCPCVSSRSRSQLKVKYLTNKYYTLWLSCPYVSSRSRSQLKVNYHTIKYETLCPVCFVSPTLMERFSYS